MAIDYIIQYPCDVRKKTSDEHLLGMIKSKNRVEISIEQVQKSTPGLTREQVLSEYKMGVVVARPDGTTKQESVPLAEVLAQASGLDELAGSCKGCPANVNGINFGCIGAINYPLAKSTEEWLLNRLPDDPALPAVSLLLKFLKDFYIDGAPVDSQRNRREVYELPKPATRKWGGLFSSKKITSSQIIHMMLYMGNLAPHQSLLMSKLLNVPEVMESGSTGSGSAARSRSQFSKFMQALAVAGKLRADLWIDA